MFIQYVFKQSKIAFQFLLWVLLFSSAQVSANSQQNEQMILNGPSWQYFSELKQAGFLWVDDQKKWIKAKNADQEYVPASTTKLITALLSLQHWGEEYRFKTEFYLHRASQGLPSLVVKGFGDPFLVSEEIELMADKLAGLLDKQGVSALAGIQIDNQYYQSGLVMPGTGESDNPYDAIPSALAANFNSIYVKKQGQDLLSAEPQTPMTQSGLVIAKTIKTFQKTKLGLTQRVNLGNDEALNQRYFAEILGVFMQKRGIAIDESVSFVNQSTHFAEDLPGLQMFYTHYNSKTLSEVIRPMMKYSTNFIANQLALNLAAELYGAPATQEKVKRAYKKLLLNQFAWQSFNIEDGAGLSRNNTLAPHQLIDVLQAFRPWKKLLPEIEHRVFAKSGTLIGVSTLAGYIQKDKQFLPFAMMINQRVPYRFRNELAKELASAKMMHTGSLQ